MIDASFVIVTSALTTSVFTLGFLTGVAFAMLMEGRGNGKG
jgi:hypothetical protein